MLMVIPRGISVTDRGKVPHTGRLMSVSDGRNKS